MHVLCMHCDCLAFVGNTLPTKIAKIMSPENLSVYIILTLWYEPSTRIFVL